MALYKRKTYLINKKFQLKFSLYFVLFILVTNIFYLLTINDIYNEFIHILSSHYPNAATSYVEKKNSLFLIFSFWQLFVCSILFVIGIFISHKIAGPIYKTKMFLGKIEHGDFDSKLFFRKGDNFPELANSYNNAIESLQVKKTIIHEALSHLKDNHNVQAKELLEKYLDTDQSNEQPKSN